MRIKKLLFVVAIAAIATASMAQGFRMMRGGAMGANPSVLIQREDVQTDLALTDQQKAKLGDLRDSLMQQFRDAFQNAGEDAAARTKAMATIQEKATEELNKILTADQQKRLKEIGIQVAGNAAVLNKAIQTDLNMTDDQKAKVADLQKKQGEAMQSLFEKMRSGELQREDMQAAMKKNTDVMNTEIGKILTDDQKAKLKSMAGKTFVAAPDTGGGR